MHNKENLKFTIFLRKGTIIKNINERKISKSEQNKKNLENNNYNINQNISTEKNKDKKETNNKNI